MKTLDEVMKSKKNRIAIKKGKRGIWDTFIRYYILLDDKEIGYYQEPENEIYLTVIKKDRMEDGNPNSDWKWIKLKYKPSNAQEAKAYMNSNLENLEKFYTFRKTEYVK